MELAGPSQPSRKKADPSLRSGLQESTLAIEIKNTMRKLILAIALLMLALTFGPALRYSRATAALLEIEDPKGSHSFTRPIQYKVEEQPTSVVVGVDKVSARLYIPAGRISAPGIVVLHGIHHLGIEEPRLVNFAQVLAASGYVVLTPELPALADYHIEQGSIAIIGASAQYLAAQMKVDRVGVLGLSFAGGLALLAAADPQWSSSIAYVVAIGAHDDLARVVKFLVTDSAPEPDGSTLHLTAHEYGALITVYDHPEDFFAANDTAAARQSLRSFLWEKADDARASAAALSPRGRALMTMLLAHDRHSIFAALTAELETRAQEISQVSPAGHLGSVRVPVLLLHGAADSVIPSSETLWLARDLPPGTLREVLISPAISHVEVKGPGIGDRLRLVQWMAVLLQTAESSPHGTISRSIPQ